MRFRDADVGTNLDAAQTDLNLLMDEMESFSFDTKQQRGSGYGAADPMYIKPDQQLNSQE